MTNNQNHQFILQLAIKYINIINEICVNKKY